MADRYRERDHARVSPDKAVGQGDANQTWTNAATATDQVNTMPAATFPSPHDTQREHAVARAPRQTGTPMVVQRAVK